MYINVCIMCIYVCVYIYILFFRKNRQKKLTDILGRVSASREHAHGQIGRQSVYVYKIDRVENVVIIL